MVVSLPLPPLLLLPRLRMLTPTSPLLLRQTCPFCHRFLRRDSLPRRYGFFAVVAVTAAEEEKRKKGKKRKREEEREEERRKEKKRKREEAKEEM